MTSGINANPDMLELARRSRKLTQAQLATAIGVGQGTVSKYEMGVLPIPDGDLIQLSIVLDYPPHFFRYLSLLKAQVLASHSTGKGRILPPPCSIKLMRLQKSEG